MLIEKFMQTGWISTIGFKHGGGNGEMFPV